MLLEYINIEIGIPVIGVVIIIMYLTTNLYPRIFLYSIIVIHFINLFYRVLLYFDELKWSEFYLSEIDAVRHYDLIIFTYNYLSIVLILNLIFAFLTAIVLFKPNVKK